MRARCPASSANLGPGFDTLGLALSLYVDVHIEPSEHLVVHSSGEGAELPTDETHLGARAAIAVLGHDRFAITIDSQIPLGRGLGSSAALVAAAAAAAGSLNPFSAAAMSDGHAENAAASVFGGLVAAAIFENEVVARPLPLDASLQFVVAIPDRELATKTARGVLPDRVPFIDAVANVNRTALLIAGLGDARGLIARAGEDRLHQEARASLFPEAASLMASFESAGATIACWSGAGPSVLGICKGPEIASATRDAGEAALTKIGLVGRVLVLEADRVGLVVTDD